MDVNRKNYDSPLSLAVVRSFTPARIEHELLAKVFEIAEHRALGDGRTCHSISPGGRVPEYGTRYGSGDVSSLGTHRHGRVAREAVT